MIDDGVEMAKSNFDGTATISNNGHRMLTESALFIRYNLYTEVLNYYTFTFAQQGGSSK